MRENYSKRDFVKSIIKPLSWYDYNLKHEYGNGSVEASNYIGNFEILICIDENNLPFYFCKQILSTFKDLEKAKEAYEDYYVSCVCGLIDSDKLKEKING